jgi:Tol biopolymer transport system component/subtilisin family serine protease
VRLNAPGFITGSIKIRNRVYFFSRPVPVGRAMLAVVFRRSFAGAEGVAAFLMIRYRICFQAPPSSGGERVPLMNKSRSFVAFFLSLLLLGSSITAISQTGRPASDMESSAPKRPELDFVPGEILVRFRNESQAKVIERSEMSVRAEGRTLQVRVEPFAGSKLVEGLRLARVPAGDTLSAIAELSARPEVLYAEPNYVRRINKLPNDPRFSEMWGLKNTGQPNGNGNPGSVGADIDAELAWNTTTGSRSVVVGVIDEGIDVNHEDLKDNIWKNPVEVANGVDDDGNGYVDDVNGWDFYHNDKTVFDGTGNYPADETDAHGTHVAGTIGASGDNGTGVVGINWQVSLMSLKILGPDGGSSAGAISAYNYAGKMRELWDTTNGAKGANIRVLNNSYGGGGFSQAESDAIRALADRGILFVVSAGNENSNNDNFPVYPANYISPNLISVAASDRSDLRPSYTNIGAATVNMAAPGSGILSTTPNNTYDFYDGTSMAAPHVSGAAALVCAAFPNISMRRLRSALLYSGEVLEKTSYYTVIASGRRLNAANALQNAASADTTPPAAVTLNNAFWYFRKVSLSWTVPGDDGTSGQAAAYELRFSETDLSSPAQFELARPLPVQILPNPAGSFQGVDVEIPWQHPKGFLGIRAVDEAGNAGPIVSIPVNLTQDVGDPYTVAQSAPAALSTGGTALGMVGDDLYKSYNLPFAFPFFGSTSYYQYNVTVSTNGAIYFGFPPTLNTHPDDAISSVTRLNGYRMIAGLWDDLRTDRHALDDIYVVQPDADRIIFRWQAVTFDTPIGPTETRGENPVSFEIELRRDGTIQVRYGDGNQNLIPIVGLGGGMPDAYVVDSHTSPYALKNLGNAPALTFSLRQPQPAPTPTPTPVPTPTPTPAPTPVPTPIPGLSGRVVYTGVIPGGTTDIYTMNADGSGDVNLTNDTAYDNTPEWSPDGSKIAFTKAGYVNIMNQDGSGLRRLTTTQAIEEFPSWSPDGSKIIFDTTGQIRMMSVDGSSLAVSLGVTGFEPRWSPDGTKILYKDSNNTLESQLWVMNTDGSNKTQLTNLPGGKNTARWSPDGSRITFTNGTGAGASLSEVYVMNANGSGLTKLTSGGEDKYLAWSPDGAKIMFSRFGQFHVINADGASLIKIINSDRTKSYPSWKANSSTNTPATVSLSSTTYSAEEGAVPALALISVNRTGDNSQPVTVNYSTSDSSGSTPCQINTGGTASDRCDYATAVGTLRFAAGETSKTIQIPLIDDRYIEPVETFTLTLSNAQGAALGISTATVSIINDDVLPATSNPIDVQAFFIRQQYVDFLGRVAEPAGFDFWNNRMFNCPAGQTCDRVDTSQRFFQSDEFQERGFYVYRLYDGVLGRLPRYAEFVPDVARLNGFQSVTEQRASKDAYLSDLINKTEFRNLYGTYLSADGLAAVDAAGFVNALCARAGITPSSKQTLIDNLQGKTKDPAHTLEDFILSPEMSGVGTKFYDRGFITMQYFGYLRRDPEQAGFDFWQAQLIGQSAPHRLDYHFMVGGFLQSDEYRFRFAAAP